MLAMIITVCITGCSPADKGQTVNPLIGDASYVSAFGERPGDQANEDLRVRTHLAYVERMLRHKSVSGLSPALQAKRARMLDLLRDYREAGIFPKNYDHPGTRRPCFIDREGRICAVGYLVEQTAGRETAEAINLKYKYENLLAMNDRVVDEWIAGSGLTKEEAAMIQPTYGYTPPPANGNHIEQDYGTASAVLTGINLSMVAINGIQMANQSGHKALPMAGLLTGVGQLLLGAGNFPDEGNESQKLLCMVNIGLGTAGIVLSAWNLMSNRPQKDRRTSWNVYTFPTRDNTTGVALSMTRRF
jgi:hypothetical protein